MGGVEVTPFPASSIQSAPASEKLKEKMKVPIRIKLFRGQTAAIISQLQQFSSITAAISQRRPARRHQAACLVQRPQQQQLQHHNQQVV